MGKLDEVIERQRRIATHFDQRETRARELARTIPQGRIYVALHGITVVDDIVLADGLARLRKVHQPPGLVELTRAADHANTDYLGVARHSERVTAELVMDETDWDLNTSLSMAWTIVVMLKLRGHQNIIAPFCSPVSVDAVPGITNQSVHFQLLDDYTARLVVPHTPQCAAVDDAAWTGDRILPALDLRRKADSGRFSLAFELYHKWNHTGDYRIAMTQLWSALEALFGKRDDKKVTASLCRRLAEWVPGTSLVDVRALYDRRCDIVHGRPLHHDEAMPYVYASADLLRRALVRAIDTGTRTLDDWN